METSGKNIEWEMYLWSERNLEPDGNSRMCSLHSTPVFALQCFHSGPFASASSPLSSAISLILTRRICVRPSEKQRWMFSALTSPRRLRLFSAVTLNEDVNHNNLSETQIAERSLLPFLHSGVTSYLLFSVCLGTHTFLR